jgi:hypothetical protein
MPVILPEVVSLQLQRYVKCKKSIIFTVLKIMAEKSQISVGKQALTSLNTKYIAYQR